MNGDSSSDGSGSGPSDSESDFFQDVPESEHTDRELASVVASAQVVDAPGPNTEGPSGDDDAKSVVSDSDSVTFVSSVVEDHCSVVSVDDPVTAANTPCKRKHSSGSSDDIDRVLPKAAGGSSCKPVLDSVDDRCTLLGVPAVVDSPLSTPDSVMDRWAEVTPTLGVDLFDPPSLLVSSLPREPALLDDEISLKFSVPTQCNYDQVFYFKC